MGFLFLPLLFLPAVFVGFRPLRCTRRTTFFFFLPPLFFRLRRPLPITLFNIARVLDFFFRLRPTNGDGPSPSPGIMFLVPLRTYGMGVSPPFANIALGTAEGSKACVSPLINDGLRVPPLPFLSKSATALESMEY